MLQKQEELKEQLESKKVHNSVYEETVTTNKL